MYMEKASPSRVGCWPGQEYNMLYQLAIAMDPFHMARRSKECWLCSFTQQNQMAELFAWNRHDCCRIYNRTAIYLQVRSYPHANWVLVDTMCILILDQFTYRWDGCSFTSKKYPPCIPGSRKFRVSVEIRAWNCVIGSAEKLIDFIGKRLLNCKNINIGSNG